MEAAQICIRWRPLVLGRSTADVWLAYLLHIKEVRCSVLAHTPSFLTGSRNKVPRDIEAKVEHAPPPF
jgi:hypothetical protein